MDMSVAIAGLRLDHPVINGSGTFDAIAARRAFGDALLPEFPFSMFVSKTITPEPRAGNPPPRIFETPAGMINSIGLPNKGLEGFLARDLPQLADLHVPLCVSVMATSHGEFARLVDAVADRDEVAALELNVSCPNVESGLIVGEQPPETLSLLRTVRPLTEKPLIVKLTPNVADPAAVGGAAEEGGADAISLVNTLKAMARRPGSLEPWLGAGRGGLSGPAIRPVALEQVRAVAGRVEVPVIGMGGIESGADALDFLVAGAAAIAVGTANFRARGLASAANSRRSSRRPDCRLWSSSTDRSRHRPQLEVEANFVRKPKTTLAPRVTGHIIAAADGLLRRYRYRCSRAKPRAADAGPAEGKRDPLEAGAAEARPQGGKGHDRDAAPRPARLRDVGEGVRHDPRGSEVRPGQGEQDPDPVPDLAVQDDRRPLRAPARRAGLSAPAVTRRGAATAAGIGSADGSCA